MEKTLCPPGIAEGAFDLRNRGFSLDIEVTCWPRHKNYAFTSGSIHDPWDPIMAKGIRLWNQEFGIFIRQRKQIVLEMLIDLDSGKALPRFQEYKYSEIPGTKKRNNNGVMYDPRPYPEDFKLMKIEETVLLLRQTWAKKIRRRAANGTRKARNNQK